MANPESITKPMTYDEFFHVFKSMALFKFDPDRIEGMAGLYFKAVSGFSIVIWRRVCFEYAMSPEQTFPKPGFFRERCKDALAEVVDPGREIKRQYTDEQCYSEKALKARSAFFKLVNDMATKRQPGEGTFLRALNSAVTDQVEAMERVVIRDEKALEKKVEGQPDQVQKIARALA